MKQLQITKPKLPHTFILTILLMMLWQTTTVAQSIFNYELKDVNGNEEQLGNIWGEKLTIFDFWASWCKPCLKAIPELIKLSDEFKDQGVKFIGINEDSPRNSSKIKPLTNTLGINYSVLLDTEQELMNDLIVSTLPTLIIFNSKGEVLFTHIGYTPGDEAIIKETINKLLNEKE